MALTLKRNITPGIVDQGEQYTIHDDGELVGVINEQSVNFPSRTYWTWNIVFHAPGPRPSSGSGSADTLDEAKAAFKVAWLKYCAAMAPEHWEMGLRWNREAEARIARVAQIRKGLPVD